MAYSSERWSRGCGTGIGLSGHKNQYRLGVSIENWVEDSYSKSDTVVGENTLWGAPAKAMDGSSTYTNSFDNDEKSGPGILSIADRQDLQAYQGTGKGHMFSHGFDPSAYEKATHYATVNSLVHGEPHANVPKVSQNLWAGSKFNDSKVPLNGATMKTEMMDTATAKIHKEQTESMYLTSNAAAHGATADTMMGGTQKTGLLMPDGNGGQKPQPGRKAKGEMCDTFDLTHQKTGLRK
mmetsp:Transcript_26655/g.32371  ORF Transcript_26655/g.32371 Transcript_26655/m.32371 type:complete len:237 (-) Transcript_26655:346-1056(-)|eukprot:CAMPEP_0197847434 /NCGR_PEP_ID=MMETSP1438-20131217/6137_1 /TAXON_ID=1461541 /ORGANISM="Pterosperma sp., Strain CCMP1384" /LENGTH=236 /DNA_ID=CAMNT_0043459351 /DNA_START=88 /DNA_END=798 /DNA_ORIENTATION=+